METLAVQPHHTGEQVDYYLRKYNDVTTWLAETLDGSMRTPFEYRFDGRELIAEDGSKLGKVFEDAIGDAQRLAANNPSLSFERRRRHLELEEYKAMLGMAKGELPNTLVVISDFPPELMHASQDVGGYNITRKQTMLRVLAWDGSRMHMFSQTLDGSDRTALEAIYHYFGQSPEPGELLGQRIHQDLVFEDQKYLTDRLTGIYDRSLTERYEGQWYAGRPEEPHDTYQFVLSQTQLVDHFIAAEMHGGATDAERYNIAALISKRFEASKQSAITFTEAEVLFGGMTQNLEWQLCVAGNEARAAGKTFSGCGASAGPLSAEGQMTEAGYGNKSDSDEDKYGSLEFKCPKGHNNRRPYGKLIENCQKCGVSVRC